MGTAYRPRRSRKLCRRSRDGHHASRKPSRYPDSGRIAFANSCQDKLGVEKGQLDVHAESGDIGFGK
jgi:hypothetical protein